MNDLRWMEVGMLGLKYQAIKTEWKYG